MATGPMFGYVCVGLLFLVLAVYGENQAPRVNIPQGGLLGKYFTTRNGRTVAGFLGIPYAAPPVGELRFKSPQPAAAWTGVRDATEYGSVCPQVNVFQAYPSNNTLGSEDCLFLNVFTPKVDRNGYLPVMVFIHGGGYFVGSSQAYAGPEYILDKDIVLVAINYRLGVLGFVTTEDTVLPGNYGLKDQSAALRWIRDNIEYFGGNKDSVTIFGESAGGSSVNMHMYSPLSRGLFHAGIAQSGTAHNSWNLFPPGFNKKYAERLGASVGCSTQDSKQLAECLLKVPYDKLASLSTITTKYTLEMIFRPNMEPEWDGAFMTKYPIEMITSVPIIIGLNSEEGALHTSILTKEDTNKGLQVLIENFEELALKMLCVNDKTKSPKVLAQKLKKFYFGDNKINKESVKQVVNMLTDVYLHDITRAIRNHRGPLYYYYFNYKGSMSLSPIFGNKDDLGVAHLDELLYIFPLENFVERPEPTSEDVAMSEKLIELWTNFATYRNPTPRRLFTVWEPVMTPDLEYLHISNEGFSMNKSLLKDRLDFWDSLQLQHNLPGIEFPSTRLKDEL